MSAGGPHKLLTGDSAASLPTWLARACSRRSGDLPAAADKRRTLADPLPRGLAAALVQDAASAFVAGAAHPTIGVTPAIRPTLTLGSWMPAPLGLSGLREVSADT